MGAAAFVAWLFLIQMKVQGSSFFIRGNAGVHVEFRISAPRNETVKYELFLGGVAALSHKAVKRFSREVDGEFHSVV